MATATKAPPIPMARAMASRTAFRLREPRLRGVMIVTTVDLFVWTVTINIIYGMAVDRFGFTTGDIGPAVLVDIVYLSVMSAIALGLKKMITSFLLECSLMYWIISALSGRKGPSAILRP